VRIFTLLESMQEDMRENKRLLRLLLAKSSAQEQTAPALPEGIVLPVRSEEELIELDDRLASSQSVSSMVSCT